MSAPKIELWMVAAAKEIYDVDKWESFHHFFNQDGVSSSQAQQKVVNGFAAIIASHAPDQASVPIGPDGSKVEEGK